MTLGHKRLLWPQLKLGNTKLLTATKMLGDSLLTDHQNNTMRKKIMFTTTAVVSCSLQICKKWWPNILFHYTNIQNTWAVINMCGKNVTFDPGYGWTVCYRLVCFNWFDLWGRLFSASIDARPSYSCAAVHVPVILANCLNDSSFPLGSSEEHFFLACPSALLLSGATVRTNWS